jgi:zinc and cadmium transporter
VSTLGWIVLTCVAGGVLSVLAAAAFALRVKPARVPMLISFAVGALLGAVFLEILPTAFGQADSLETMAATLLGGILLFFVLEKLVLWRHCHEEQCEAHDPNQPAADHGRSGMMIMIGDTVHNFVDVPIAAAFLADICRDRHRDRHHRARSTARSRRLPHSAPLGLYAQGVRQNLISSLAMVVGGLLGYAALSELPDPDLAGLAAASMLTSRWPIHSRIAPRPNCTIPSPRSR